MLNTLTDPVDAATKEADEVYFAMTGKCDHFAMQQAMRAAIRAYLDALKSAHDT